MPLQNLDINAPASRANGLTGANYQREDTSNGS